MRRWLDSSPERATSAARAGLVLAAGVVIGVAAERAAFEWDDPLHWLPDLVVGLTFSGAVGVSLPLRPATGWLLAAIGFCWFVGNLSPMLLYLHRGPLVHLLVTYPEWRPRSRPALAAVAAGYAAAVIAPIWRSEGMALVLATALVTFTAVQLRAATGRARRDRRTALQAAIILATAIGGGSLVRLAFPAGDAVEPALLAYQGALCWIAVLLAARARPPRAAAVANLVVELEDNPSGTLRDALAETLGDPTLQIGYWSPDGDYRDVSGRPVEIPNYTDQRAATFVERDSQPFAVLVHDRSVLDEPALVEAVATATRLTEANTALLAEVRAQIEELAASRKRLILAADEERHRLERRLQGGVERRVAALTGDLQELSTATSAGEHVRRAEAHLTRTLTDLEALARGLHPRELELGLSAALSALAQRCPVPVQLTMDAGSVPSGETAVAAYYICAEALTNVAKHAAANRVRLRVAKRPGRLLVDVTDDGVGRADPSQGSGLRGLTDRVEALGGTLTVSSPIEGGTRLAAELPLPPAHLHFA